MYEGGWIDGLLEATDLAETPRSYIYWSGIATIAAVISPNVWINRGGYYLLTPNVFVILIGESGLGKGLPIAISKRLLKIVNSTRVISGRNTIEAILKSLASSKTEEKTGTITFKDARGYIVSGEFATLFASSDDALPVITDLYDTHYNDDWDNTTKTAGIDKLTKPCITLFGGSTPEHFSNVVPETDVRGGFVGRILTVYEETRHRINPLSDTNGKFEFPYKELTEHLSLLSKVKGPFHFTDKGKKVWEEWYEDIRARKIDDPTGTINRLPDNVLKVAMCIALSKRIELNLYPDDLNDAIDKCMQLTTDSKRLTSGRGKSATADQTDFLFKALWRAPDNVIVKSKFLKHNYGMFDIFELDKAISTLVAAGVMVEYKQGKDFVLKMKPEAVENTKNWLKKKGL